MGVIKVWTRLVGRHPPVTIAAAGLTAAFALLLLFASDPWRVEALYVRGVGPWIQALPNALARPIPFSMAEPLVVGSGAVALIWLVRRVRQLWRPPPGQTRGQVARHALVVAYTAGVSVALSFYVLWGLAYARPPLELRQGWVQRADEPFEVDAAELEALAEVLVDRVNALYLGLHGLPDGFAPTLAPDGLDAADAAVDRGWPGAVQALELHPSVAHSRGPTKGIASSLLYTWLGIGGFYFPFTAEANINWMAPEWQQPHTMAHEKAHQRFFASENEANFYGFVVCTHSDDPFVQYSGWLFAQRQVLSALRRLDSWAFLRQIERRNPGVQRDVLDAYTFWTGYDGPMADLSHAVNDAYLKVNRVQGGVQSYSRSLELLVRYARSRDGSLQPGPTRSRAAR